VSSVSIMVLVVVQLLRMIFLASLVLVLMSMC
jgi:hypothetical protein